jgi:hypothetical protein
MRFPAWTPFSSVLLAALVFAGCATQKVDWKSRVGNYTYDQAVHEYGPPDRSAKLEDGSTVADWVVREGRTVVTPRPYLAPADGFGPAGPAFTETYVPSYYMRLMFGADGNLKEFKNFSR